LKVNTLREQEVEFLIVKPGGV